MARWLTAIAAPVALLFTGCDVITGGCGDELAEQGPVTNSVGTTDGGIYQSSSWDPQDWVDFPPGISVRFEHSLGETPRLWHAYVATTREGDGSNLVLASGSEAELIDIDEDAVTIKNATCVEFFVVLVAMTSVEDDRDDPP